MNREKITLNADLERIKQELKNSQHHNFKKEMENAREEIGRAQEKIKAYKEMLQKMEEDGLLKKGDNYRVEFKDNELFINGKKQPDPIRNKYRHYFKENMILQKQAEDMEEDDNEDKSAV